MTASNAFTSSSMSEVNCARAASARSRTPLISSCSATDSFFSMVKRHTMPTSAAAIAPMSAVALPPPGVAAELASESSQLRTDSSVIKDRLSRGFPAQHVGRKCSSSTIRPPHHSKFDGMTTDIEIAQKAKLQRISEVAENKLGIDDRHLDPYGHYKAKVSLDYVNSLAARPDGKLILVTAITPTPAGEGKTTTTVGLGDALNLIGKKACICLREPSLGPVFGMKGGAAGGGYAQGVPMEDINLHFTGDFNAIQLANNLLAALIDNHIHHGNELGIDVRRITWKRVVDMNDRALRDITVGLGGPGNGYPRQDGFDIVVASEVMAIFCLATSLKDLKERLGNIVIGYTSAQKAIRARDLHAHGAMAVLLKDALKPNLVQTLENNPALIHGGPFANIAHGCNSVLATRAGLKLADYVVTEAGFGADVGAEKFVDIKCRKAGLKPDCVVLVATIRALKMHGGVAKEALKTENLAALRAGFANLGRHIANIRS